jgi:ubiquinone/menaquinone biosynthesis C-methylase UbiE
MSGHGGASPATSGGVAAHYDRLAASFDESWAYSPDFTGWMTSRILDRAGIRPGDRVADIGCGTGLYARGLARLAGHVVCVDPSQAMLDQLPAGSVYLPVRATAEEVASGAVGLPYATFDVIVMKEAIHHVSASDRPGVLRGLAALLAPQGRIVVVMLPTRIGYPLFSAALKLFEQHQPDPASIADILAGAGLRTELTYDSFPLSFSKQRYAGMIRNRYMSLLASFTDAELESGIAEISERYPGDRLDFRDRFAFIRGIRSQVRTCRRL